MINSWQHSYTLASTYFNNYEKTTASKQLGTLGRGLETAYVLLNSEYQTSDKISIPVGVREWTEYLLFSFEFAYNILKEWHQMNDKTYTSSCYGAIEGLMQNIEDVVAVNEDIMAFGGKDSWISNVKPASFAYLRLLEHPYLLSAFCI